MVRAARDFVPLFVDTLEDLDTTRRFHEFQGSYPVLRVHDARGRDIGGRLDGNLNQGHISVREILLQFKQALSAGS